jgi:hypothetical protein
MKVIRQAIFADRFAINTLRIEEFKRANEFSLIKPECLLWDQCDDDNVVLTAWDGQNVVSTMRVVFIGNFTQATQCLQCTVPAQVTYPAIVLNSGATQLEYRRIGLNSALRYYVIEAAERDKINTIIGPIYKGAPRTNFMQKLGYTFITPTKSWQNKLNPKKVRLLAILEKVQFNQAAGLIKTSREDVLREFPWTGDPISFPLSSFISADQKDDS